MTSKIEIFDTVYYNNGKTDGYIIVRDILPDGKIRGDYAWDKYITALNCLGCKTVEDKHCKIIIKGSEKQ